MVYSRQMTTPPAFGGDDITLCSSGLRIKAGRLQLETLSQHKWVLLVSAEDRKLAE